MADNLYAETSEPKRSEARMVSLWQERIGIAKKAQDQFADESGATRFINEYRGDYGIAFQGRTKKITIPPINEVFAYVQADVATTYNRDPYITVNAKAGTTKGAALWEVTLNYWWRELKTKEELEYEIVDKDLVGYSWHKVGYNPVTDKIFSSYVPWRDVLWNVGAKRPPKDCEWMAHRIVMPLKKLKKLYPSAKGLEGVQSPDVDDKNYKKLTYKDDIKVGVIWEIWDNENRQVLRIAEGLKERFLEKPAPWPDYLDEFPLVMYWDFLVPGRAQPMSAIAPWEAQILEEMVLMGSALNHSKRWNRQAFVKNSQIDENSQDKFERGDDGAIISVSGDVGPDAIRFVDFGQIPTDFYLLMDRLQAIKRNINGQPEFVRGGVTKTGTRTIGELQLMQAGNKGRQDRKMDRLETHCENISRHMMAHLKANFDFESTLKISGETPEEVIEALGENYNQETGQVTFTAEDIQGEYDVEVKAGSTLPLDKQNRIQVLETILTTVAAATAQGPMSNFMSTLIQELLKDYDIKSLEEAYKKDLMAAQKAAMENQNQQTIDDEKTAAEAMKRQAQAKQISVDTEITEQDAQLGSVGRALIKKLEKPAPKEPVGASK